MGTNFLKLINMWVMDALNLEQKLQSFVCDDIAQIKVKCMLF